MQILKPHSIYREKLKKIFNGMKDSNPQRKFALISIVLFIFLLIGSTVFIRHLLLQEEKDKRSDILDKGIQLVSLISLHPVEDFTTHKRDFFFRTLMENPSHTGIVYCFVHDCTGKVLASFVSSELADKMPNEIHTRVLPTMELTKQIFYEPGSGQTIYEYSKPIFQDSQWTGTVRLGLRFPPVSFLSPERISLLSMVAFLMCAAGFMAYYGTAIAIQPVHNIIRNIKNICSGSILENRHTEKGMGIVRIIGDLDRSFLHLKKRLNKIESENLELTTKIGAVSFEKNQVINLLNSLNFGIISVDIHDNIFYMNHYMCNLLRRQLKDVLDQPLNNILRNDEIVSFISHQEITASNMSAKYIETTFPDFSPGEYFQVSFCNFADNEGQTIGKMILVKNITKEKLGEKTQQEFISHVSHELLTPLTTIKSYSEMLISGEIDKGEMQKEFYNTISDETTRLTRLIHNLLNITRIESGSLSINKNLVRTKTLYEDCVASINASALSKKITFKKNIPDKFPALLGDKELLQVAINNILNNAVKYTPEGGTIVFSINDHDTMVTFDVLNTGYGISQKDMPHIFNKSYRSSDPHVAEQTGSGLGLTIALEIIHLHGGEIEVRSEPGKETSFTINIPKEEYSIEHQ